MRHVDSSPTAMIASLLRNFNLIREMTKREIVGRYRGSALGIVWSLFEPMLLLGVYTFVFSVVFKARWGGEGDSKGEFAIILFAGLIVYGLFAECLNRAPSLVLNHPNYVKKVLFPLEILPWVALGVAIFHASISLLVLLVFILVQNHTLPWTVLALPLVFLPVMIISLGVGWFLSSLGVFVRDIGQMVGLISTVLLFASPVFYPLASIPEAYRGLLALNPLAMVIEQTRDVLIWGRLPNILTIAIQYVAAISIAWLGFAWFQRTRNKFADVM